MRSDVNTFSYKKSLGASDSSRILVSTSLGQGEGGVVENTFYSCNDATLR
jgi:hypothetical protein